MTTDVPDGPAGSGSRLCIVSPETTTFIRAHAERLPGAKSFLYGGYVPTHLPDGRPLVPLPSLLERGLGFVVRVALGIEPRISSARKEAFARFLLEQRVEAVLAEYGPTGEALHAVCRDVGVPLVVHFHGYDAYSRDVVAKNNRYAGLFQSAAAIVAVSRAMQQQLARLGAPSEKVYWIPCGADTAKFSGAHPAKAPPLFVAAGRFVEKKAPQLTIRAFSRVVERVPAARLRMLGGGMLLEECRGLVRRLRLEASVTLEGPASHDEIASAMRQARAFVQHSKVGRRGDSEGTPVAIMEAGAAGLPVVSTRHGGIPDVVLHGRTGFLVDEGDVDGMGEAMIKLCLEPELAGEFGSEANRRVRAEFSLDASIAKLSRLIDETVLKVSSSRKGAPAKTA